MFRNPYLVKSVRLQGGKSAALEMMRGRIVMIGLFFALAYAAVAFRAFEVSVFQGNALNQPEREALFAYNNENQGHKPRGDIYDRNGVLLATTLPGVSLYVDPALIIGHEEVARDLTRIIPDLDYGVTLQRLQSSNRFVWIRRNITPQQQYEVLALGQPGLGFERQQRRFYPQGALASHLIGYTNVDNSGLAGLERSFENHLASGKDLRLSLDIRVQHIVHRELQRAIDDFTGIAGVGIVMDLRNGEIIAGVSLPDFDPHNAGSAGANEMFNRMTLGVYELGSIFKVFTTAAGLELANIPLSKPFDARTPLRFGRHTISDFRGQNRVLTMAEVFMYSSNIGTAKIAEMIGAEGLRGFYDDLGLLKPMDIVFREVGRPLSPQNWRHINMLTASYGHGISTTPLQTTAAIASIMNGGLLVTPQFVVDAEALESGGRKNTLSHNAPSVRVVSEDTSEKMRALMRLVVSNGTGSKADVAGYEVGGKTGTADKVGASGRYERNKRISSFVGIYPSSDPQYAILVMVDEPKPNKHSFGFATAGWVSAPAMARIVSSMASVLGQKPALKPKEQDAAHSMLQYISAGGTN
ncbi:MAG: peptidoglycan D,D-transpeptidase FtsI family protein [Alphaproteobacteria bacterium]